MSQRRSGHGFGREKKVRIDANMQDVRYLTKHLEQVLAENAERAEWDHLTVERVKK